MEQRPSETLTDALEKRNLTLPSAQVEELGAYCRLLWQWNQKLNLTRHTDFDTFVARDVVDSLQLSQLLANGEEVLDLGSGGGVPGIVLATLRPDLKISLSESVGKRAAVLESLVESLSLRTPVYRSRGEHVLENARFDTVIARAVGPLWKILKWVQPRWGSLGRLLLVKGPRWVDERGEARHRGLLRGLELRCEATYRTPGTNAENVILKIWRKASS